MFESEETHFFHYSSAALIPADICLVFFVVVFLQLSFLVFAAK